MIKKKSSYFYDWSERRMTTHVMLKIFIVFGILSVLFISFL